MDKNKIKLFPISAILLSLIISPVQSHDGDHSDEMNSEEITEMVLGIINGVVDAGDKALENAMTKYTDGSANNSLPDLIEDTSPAVVRIAIRGTMQSQPNPFFDDPFFERFFGQPQMPREREFGGGGSGVIVDGDLGYIITNAHVIDRARSIT